MKRNRPKQRVINIDAEAHQSFKDYCDREGLRMSPTATKIILAAIEKKSSESVDTGR
mgnify:FL=1